MPGEIDVEVGAGCHARKVLLAGDGHSDHQIGGAQEHQSIVDCARGAGATVPGDGDAPRRRLASMRRDDEHRATAVEERVFDRSSALAACLRCVEHRHVVNPGDLRKAGTWL